MDVIEAVSALERISTLEKNQEEIKGQLVRALKLLGAAEFFGVDYLAKRLGVSISTVRKHPWELPFFGKSEREGPMGWTLETIDEWYSIPLGERKSQWIEMNEVERAKLRGTA